LGVIVCDLVERLDVIVIVIGSRMTLWTLKKLLKLIIYGKEDAKQSPIMMID
jgi:hypothetical protein